MAMKMRKKKKRVALLCALAIGASSVLTGCQIGKTDVVVSKNLSGKQVFSIGNATCSLNEAKVYLVNYQNIYGNTYGIDLLSEKTKEDSLQDYVKKVTLSELTKVVCMDLLAESEDLSLSQEDEELVSKAAKEYYDSLTKEEISYLGVSQSDIVTYYEHYALAQKLYNSLTGSVNEEVSDDEARVMEAMQIYITDKDKAQEAAERLSAGEDFASVASNYNEGGNIELNIARDDLPKEVEKVAFNLENDEVSGMISTDNGYYFVKCLNKYNEELTDANKVNIIEKREKEAFDDVYEEFIKKQGSYLNEKVWDALELETQVKMETNTFFETYDTYCSDI